MTPEVTDAVIAALDATGIPTGDGRKPAGAGWQGTPGASVYDTYFVVHAVGGRRDGPDAPLSDRRIAPQDLVQVNAVGITRAAVEDAATLAAAVLWGVDLAVTGHDTVAIVHETSAGVSLDESVNPPVYLAVDRYRVETSPQPITSS